MDHSLPAVNPVTYAPLHTFVDWLRETDDHASYHVALIDRAERCLVAGNSSANEASSVAEKLERWRYQHLHQHAFRLSSRDEAFVGALNLIANQLAGRTSLSLRQTFHTIHNASLESKLFQEAAETIDPQYPLDLLKNRARQLTVDHFSTTDQEHSVDSPRWQMLL